MQLSTPPLIFLIVLIAGFIMLVLAITRGSGAPKASWRSAARACRDPFCRAPNIMEARFCARCGKKLD